MVQRICGEAQVAQEVTKRTGLIPDAYFSASKLRWILDSVPGAQARAEAGELCFGTVDSWLVWALTSGRTHATDFTNASRTMLFNIHSGEWDPWLLELFGIPAAMLPEARPSCALFGLTTHPGIVKGVPICGVAGDQQAALFGQKCWSAGAAKNTYGTGCFLLMHTGQTACRSKSRLVTTIAASAPVRAGGRQADAALGDGRRTAAAAMGAAGGRQASAPAFADAALGAAGGADAQTAFACAEPVAPRLEYALEGSIFTAGALIQWLRDEMGIIKAASQTQELAQSVPDAGGVHIVPAFTGLGAPWWDAEARGMISGLTRGTSRAHIARAALESLAWQVCDLALALEEDSGLRLELLKADGGAAANDFLMQFQSDVLGVRVERPASTEATALGAAFLAGLYSGFWDGLEQIASLEDAPSIFAPSMDAADRSRRFEAWREAVARCRGSRQA